MSHSVLRHHASESPARVVERDAEVLATEVAGLEIRRSLKELKLSNLSKHRFRSSVRLHREPKLLHSDQPLQMCLKRTNRIDSTTFIVHIIQALSGLINRVAEVISCDGLLEVVDARLIGVGRRDVSEAVPLGDDLAEASDTHPLETTEGSHVVEGCKDLGVAGSSEDAYSAEHLGLAC